MKLEAKQLSYESDSGRVDAILSAGQWIVDASAQAMAPSRREALAELRRKLTALVAEMESEEVAT